MKQETYLRSKNMELLLYVISSVVGGAIIGYTCYPFFHLEELEWHDAEIEEMEKYRNDRK
jgi:hypothetical protein